MRREAQAEAIRATGLRIGQERLRRAAHRGHRSGRLGDVDRVIVATKATQLEDAAARLEGQFPDAVVMTIQNGLGAEEIVGRFGGWPIISAVTFMSGVRHADAHVEYELDTATWLGPYAGTATPYETVDEIAGLLVAGGLVASLPDLLPAQWSKLIFNATVNTVAAVTGLPHVALFAAEDAPTDLGHLVHELVDEGKSRGRGGGDRAARGSLEMNVLAVSRGETGRSDYAHLPSMLEDVNARRPTEVDFITGALVREARRLDVPVPRHETMYRLVKGKEWSWR